MNCIIEDEKSICSSLSANRGLKSKSNIKTQKKLSFTPTQASKFKEKHQVDLDETSESNDQFMSKSVHSSQATTFSTRSIFMSESFVIFEEEFSELIESLRRFSRTKTVKVTDKKKRLSNNDCFAVELCSDFGFKHCNTISSSMSINNNSEQASTSSQSLLKQEDFQKMTNIQEIKDFNDYTNECIKLIAKMVVPDIASLDSRFISLPFAHGIGYGNDKKRLAIFDLDETLIHCELKDIYSAQQIIDVVISSTMRKTVGLNIRPNMKEKLMKLKARYYLIVYTASQQKYADAILDTIDPDNSLFSYRLYRNNCTLVNVEDQPLYVKDLRIFKGIELKDIVIIDNSVLSFGFHLSNGVPILPYYKGNDDKELFNLRKFLEQLADIPDIPAKLKSLMRLEENVAKCRDKEDFDLDTIEELENSYVSLDNSGSSNSSFCRS